MEIELDSRKRPVRVKSGRYSANQPKFLKAYVGKLVELGFIVSNPNENWQAALFCVPKPSSKAMFRLTIDLRLMNTAIIKKSWPMPHIDSEMIDFAGSKCFASIDLCPRYWQLPMDSDSYDACGIICPHGTYSSTRVLQGLTNAAAHFQSSIELFFQN